MDSTEVDRIIAIRRRILATTEFEGLDDMMFAGAVLIVEALLELPPSARKRWKTTVDGYINDMLKRGAKIFDARS